MDMLHKGAQICPCYINSGDKLESYVINLTMGRREIVSPAR